MSLTKADLVKSISNKLNISKTKARLSVDYLLESMKTTLVNGEDILISSFGKFCVKDNKNRRGRNYQISSDSLLEAGRVVIFKCSPCLKNKINGI